MRVRTTGEVTKSILTLDTLSNYISHTITERGGGSGVPFAHSFGQLIMRLFAIIILRTTN